ncbi:TolC family protein [Aeromonas salmonicida]
MLGSAQAQTVSFSEAWSRVIQQDDGLAAEQAGVDRAKQLREAAKAMYLPKVDVGASYTHLDQPMELDMMDLNPIASHPEFGKVLAPVMQALNLSASDFVTPLTKQNVVTSSVKMLWPLFTGGRIDAAQDIRQAQVSEAQQLLVLKQQSTFESLSQTYFGVVLAAQVVQTKQEIEQGLAHHLDHARKLEAQGQIAKVERLSAQSAYDRARIDTQKSRRTLEIAQLELIPTPLNWLAQWVPSTPAIEGFLRLNQMGADFDQVSRYWWQLWGLALLNGGLACWVLAWRQRSVPAVN